MYYAGALLICTKPIFIRLEKLRNLCIIFKDNSRHRRFISSLLHLWRIRLLACSNSDFILKLMNLVDNSWGTFDGSSTLFKAALCRVGHGYSKMQTCVPRWGFEPKYPSVSADEDISCLRSCHRCDRHNSSQLLGGSGLCPSSGILKTRKHVSENGSVSCSQMRGGSVIHHRQNPADSVIIRVCTSETWRWLCKIWGFHGGDYEEWRLLGCYAVWLL
jgi:hypothetical protein